MDSDGEIPCSQETTTSPVIEIITSKNNSCSGKRKKLGSVSRKSSSRRSKRDKPSTSSAVNNSAGAGSSKIDIYWDGDDDSSSVYTQQAIPTDYDVYESAKILERGNVPLSNEEIRARRTTQKNFTCTQEPISARQLIEMEERAASGSSAASTVSGTKSSHQLETRMPGFSETQFVCHLLDEAHLLIENEFSELPLEHTQRVNETPSVAQEILNDFKVDSDDEDILSTPPRLFLKKPNRKYTRSAKRRLNTTASMETNIADVDENDSDYGDDIDLNASFMIQKNMADLGVLFESQSLPQKVEMEFDDSVFERGSQSGDERIELAEDTSDSDDGGTVESKTITESGMLSEDDELFSNVTTPRIPSTVKRKRKHESIVDDFVRPAASTPATTKQSTKPTSLHPKRLRFECDRNALPDTESMPAIGLVGGFKSARGTDVGISADKMKKSASIFDEILAEFGGLPSVDGSMNAMPGFVTASSAKVPAKPSTASGFASARRIDPLPGSSTSMGFETARSAEADAPLLEDIAEPGIPSTSAGFKTARNVCFLAPSSSALKKAAALFDFEQDDDSFTFDAAPKKQVRWQDSFDTPAKSDVKPIRRPAPAADASINVSSDTYNKYAALFEEEINENMFDQCETDTSALLFNNSVTASPVNQSVPLKFITSTPNVAAAKLAMEKTSVDDFLSGCDNFFTDFNAQTQRPQNSEPSRTRLSDGFSQPDTEGKFSPSMVSQHVKRERKEALTRQQANCLRKNNIRPQSGSLQKQKSTEKRVPLKELGTPKSYSSNELAHFGVPNNVINANIDNIAKFKFEMWRYFSKDECLHNINGIEVDDGIEIIMDENSCVGFDELSSGFLACNSVDPKLVPDNWFRNSLKWILLKLAGLERSFPQRYAGTALTPANVMLQLKYRYEREIDQSQRSAIRKIVEQDDAVSKPMVLFVSRIKKTMLEYTMELSDGWYGIGTNTLDSVLANAVQKGKIRVGTKLLIQDAELIGVEEACSPLEMPSSAALKFSANSTRRVKWYTRLGFCNGGRSITFPMKSIEPHGGHISKFTAFIARIYPTLFVAKIQQTANQENPNQSRTEIRSEMVQRRLDVNENQAQFEAFEAIYSQVSAEVEREYEAKRKEMAALPSREISEIDDAEELWHLMERSHDAESFEGILNSSQKSKIREYQEKIIHEKNSEISNRVKEKFDKLDKNSRVTPLLKIRLVDCNQPAASRSAILSIWNADECSFDLRENSFIEITSVSANGIRGKDLLITANKRAKIRNIDAQLMTDALISIRRKCFQLADICESAFSPNFNEFDVVGYVLHIGSIAETKFQTVYFVDSQRRILHVKCWNGIKQYALDGVIKEGTILAIGNLEWRSFNSKSSSGWPQAFVNERTTFSANPKSQVMTDRLRRLSDCFKEMVDVTAYTEDCMSLIHERRDSGNSSAHSTTVLSDSNLSPLNRTLNNSKNESASKSRAKRKMELLKVYKSPPRTPAMNVSRSSISTLRRPFKSPMPTVIPNKTADNQENET